MKKILQHYHEQFKEMINDLKNRKTRIRQIPNLLTLTRLLAPLVIIPCAILQNYPLCLLFTTFFSFTDLLDGYIARKYNFTSELGKDLDATADKIFGLTLLISLITKSFIYVLVVLLETGIATINVARKLNNKDPKSDIVGKIKMTVLYITIGIGYGSIYLDLPATLINSSILVTALLQSATAVIYLHQDIDDENSKQEYDNTLINNIEDNNETDKKINNEINYYKSLKKSLEVEDNIVNKVKKYKK